MTAKEKLELITKLYLSRTEIIALMDLSDKRNAANKIIKKMKDEIESQLSASGKILPDSNHFPTDLVLKYLKDYGITKQQLIANAKIEIAMNKGEL